MKKLNERIELIKILDAESIKKLIPPQMQITVDDDKRFLEAIRKIDLCTLMDVQPKKTFNCVLTNCKNTKEANIYIDDSKMHYYKCFSCGKTYLANNFVQNFADCTEQQANEFLANIFNIKLEKSEWRLKIENVYDNNINKLLSGHIRKTAPTAYNYIRHDIPAIIVFNELAKHHAREDILYNGYPVFFVSRVYLAQKMSEYAVKTKKFIGTSSHAINKKIQNANILGFIQKHDIGGLPQLTRDEILGYAKSRGYNKHTNIYTIIEYSDKKLKDIENRALLLKHNDYTKRGCSFEYILRTFGEQEAKRLFPQSQYGLSVKSQDLTNNIQQIIKLAISTQKYCTEQIVMENLSAGGEKTKTQIKRCIRQLLSKNKWKKIKSNMKIKEEYKVEAKGYPIIIIQDNVINEV